jgi:hypothetical protein
MTRRAAPVSGLLLAGGAAVAVLLTFAGRRS